MKDDNFRSQIYRTPKRQSPTNGKKFKTLLHIGKDD